MLTLSKVSADQNAADYYSDADDYYVDGRSPCGWSGQGAARLGLTDTVEIEDLRALLQGQLPDGQSIHNGGSGRCGGLDLTFSAPKSVSVQALLGGDTGLVGLHDKAVTAAMAYAEQHLAAYRETHAGRTDVTRSDNLVVAHFRHDLSRANEPQLHTHNVVLNLTAREDGTWRALAFKDFFRSQHLLGAIYRSELALAVQEVGYGLGPVRQDGCWELDHLPDKVLKVFSSRARQIELALQARGKDRDTASAAERQMAALASRDRKTQMDRATLKAEWQSMLDKAAGSLKTYAAVRWVLPAERHDAALTAIRSAVAALSERQSCFEHRALLTQALINGMGHTDWRHIEQGIQLLSANQELIRKENYYTTQAAQTRELDILALEKSGRNTLAPILRHDVAEAALHTTSLNAGQRDAAALLLTTPHRVVGVRGVAGAGKSTMLAEVQNLAQTQGFRVLGLAPSRSAVKELTRRGLQADTVASFLLNTPQVDAKTLLVLDEAGMVSAASMLAVLQRVQESGARIALIGDEHQLQSVEAGRPFAQLLQADMVRVEMCTIQRQRDPAFREAVHAISQGRMADGLEKLEAMGQVSEVPDWQARQSTITDSYAAQDASARRGTLLLAGTRLARQQLNDQVREKLDLAGRGVPVMLLASKDLTHEAARSCGAYEEGDWVQALGTLKSLGMKPGDLAQVIELRSDGMVRLKKTDDTEALWRPSKVTRLVAYTARESELSLGDRVRVTVNDYRCHLTNGELGEVVDVDCASRQITVRLDSGRVQHFKIDAPLLLDHGYCMTVHSAQGQTCERVLIDAPATVMTTHAESFYVAVSRARSEVRIFTDDKALLADAVGRERQNDAALDIGTDGADLKTLRDRHMARPKPLRGEQMSMGI